VALGAPRARQGDAAAADRLYEEAVGCSFNSWLSADAMVGQAAAARRLGDLARGWPGLERRRQREGRGGALHGRSEDFALVNSPTARRAPAAASLRAAGEAGSRTKARTARPAGIKAAATAPP
jgi:hypothetical protein